MLFMGIDVGSSGCKVSVVDAAGAPTCSAYRPYAFTYEGDRSEINPDVVFAAVLDCIREITAAHDLSELATLSVTSFGEMFVLLDEQRRVLCPSISYNDRRGSEQAASLQPVGDKVYAITGATVNAMYSLPKLMWIRDNDPETYRRAHKLCMFADFILVKLGAQFHVDYSLAARTLLFDVTRKCWSQEIIDYAQIDGSLLPEPVPCGTTVGTLAPALAEELRLPRTLKLLAGGHDQSCAALGAGIIRGGIALDGMGSNECVVPCFDRPMIGGGLKESNLACVPYMLPDKYVTYAFNKTAGTTLDWYRQIRGIDSYDVLLGELAGEPSGLLFLPHFAGAATPYMDDDAVGAVAGLSLTTTREQLTRSVIEGLNYEIRVNLQCLAQAGFTLNELYVAGGMSRNDDVLQIKADILGMPIKRLTVTQTGTQAMAILGSVAMGVYPDIPTAVGALVRCDRTFTPDPARKQAYDALFAKYAGMYEAIKSVYGG